MKFEKRSSKAKGLKFHPRKKNLANFLRGFIQKLIEPK
ncbi:unnamed protein product [Brassica oleracea var. botrytis]